jgi:uncharacterized protein YndB with AHSA1/START domain
MVRVRRLGRRRVASLEREGIGEVAAYLATLADGPDDSRVDEEALGRYESLIQEERSRLMAGGDTLRRFKFTKLLTASTSTVWDAWIDPGVATQWWAPRHFSVTQYSIEAVPGGSIRVTLREGDGAEFLSMGRVVEAIPGLRLVFDLSPLDRAQQPLFQARHTLALDAEQHQTALALEIDVTVDRPEAAAAVAGLEQGWNQLLDRLENVVNRLKA